ncbi:MAG: hypothetical protein EA392_12455 [Cryomorphaceae bacterium]|nr:MAG: hypothetical protein EA392_12455 [Cryomorphaceae bacterium]
MITGCGSILKSLVGYHNVNSVDLARECMTDSALVVVRKGKEHHSALTLSHGSVLEVLYLQELGRDDEARALYSNAVKKSPFLRNTKQLEREVKKARKDLERHRKRRGYTSDCR